MPKKIPTIKINVCLVENAHPKDVFTTPATDGALTPMVESTASNLKFKPLFKRSKAGANAMSVLENTADKPKKTFKQLYNEMSETEKRLNRIYQIEIPNGADLDAILKTLQDNPNVEFAKEEIKYKPCTTPNDPLFANMYGLQQISVEQAWQYGEGKDVVIAVVDTGVDYNHPDLQGNMWKDANGKFGRDFSGEGVSPVEDDDPMDTHGHGTHVAGTIAAVKNNQLGIAGVAPQVKIMAVKIFPNATDQVVANALKYAVDNGARVLNNSWGPQDRLPSSPVIEAAVEYVHSKGGICVFAAGNSNDDVQYYSPANKPYTISVGANDRHSNRAGFSNFGDLVDVAAPGVGIMSLRFNTSNYMELSGTSMAAPHVSGLVGMLLQQNSNLTFDQVRSILMGTADPLAVNVPIGSGRINCLNAMKVAMLPPLISIGFQQKNGVMGEYRIDAIDSKTGQKVQGELIHNGNVVGQTNTNFSLPLNCQITTKKIRECDPERKPPCWWEIVKIETCQPSPDFLFVRCPNTVDVKVLLPSFTETV